VAGAAGTAGEPLARAARRAAAPRRLRLQPCRDRGDRRQEPGQRAPAREQRRPRFRTTREQREELAARFFQAAEQGDLPGLEALLAHDVELTGDGGGKVPAITRPLRGRDRVARTLISWLRPD